MNLSLLHWHIEPSSICTLKCPRCTRAEVPESLLNKQLSLDFFKNQIGSKVLKQIKRITFCGNDGDPIYCNDIIDIIAWMKDVNPDLSIVLITNGSYKQQDWWVRLANTLDNKDEIHFSIDGWDQDSNSKYRINCDYESITQGLTTFIANNNTTYVVWASIAFKFNEHMIDYMQDLAKNFGVDAFQLTLSTKFGSKYPDAYGNSDELEPSSKYIPKGHRYERKVYLLSGKSRYTETIKQFYKQRIFELMDNNQIPRLCLVGNKGVFLNSMGEFFPCCWVASRYDHNRDWIDKSKERFNLYKNTFSKVINDEFWNNKFLEFDSLECNTKCSADKLNNIDYITEW